MVAKEEIRKHTSYNKRLYAIGFLSIFEIYTQFLTLGVEKNSVIYPVFKYLKNH